MGRVPATVDPRECELLLLPTQRPVFTRHRPGRLIADECADPLGDLGVTDRPVFAFAGPKLLQILLPTELDGPRTVPAHHSEDPEGIVHGDSELVGARGTGVLVLGKQAEQVRFGPFR